MYFNPMSTPNSREEGNCTHFQPADLMALAEKHLREAGIPEAEWEGHRFHWGVVVDSPPFKGIVMQCKPKDGNWVLTKLDRRKDGIAAEEEGFRPL